ncbi:MAG: hypothetical protein FWD13_13235 [Treponema sp.]|nr:hypothetical protein [Treponema sp.]
MDSTGRVLDGSAFLERRIGLYRALEKDGAAIDMEISVVENRDKEKSIIITVKNYPMMKLRGSFPQGNNSFILTSLEYLAGSTFGWNEFSLPLLGTGQLHIGDTAILENIREIEPVQITTGRIHRFDTRITGENALTALNNRYERILTLTEWMLTLNGPRGQTIKEFTKYWKPVLVPEMVLRKNRPSAWLLENDKFQRAEDISWNTSYTERTFSEELWPVRNSGTLLRDWEEALSWIYMMYEWENIIDLFSSQIILTKIK